MDDARLMWTLFEPIHAVTYFSPEALAALTAGRPGKGSRRTTPAGRRPTGLWWRRGGAWTSAGYARC